MISLIPYFLFLLLPTQAESLPESLRAGLEPSTLLHVSFDDGSADPDINRCKAKGGIPEKYKKPEYVEGIQGQALSCKGPFRCAAYNFQPLGDAGTLNYWLRNDGANYPSNLFGLWSDTGSARLYRFYETPWIMIDAPGRERTFFSPAGTVGPGWSMVTIRWTRDSLASYLNGAPEVKRDNYPFIAGIRSIALGNDWDVFTDYAIDEFSLFDRALSDSEIAFLFHSVGQFGTEPLVVIPPAAEGRAPQIDGKVNDAEWAGAAKLTGLISSAGAPASSPSTFWLTYDSTHLYVAYHGPVPADALNDPHSKLLAGFLEAKAEQRDGDVPQDDAVGIEILPEFLQGERFILWVNARGTQYDARLKGQPAMSAKPEMAESAGAGDEPAEDEESIEEEIADEKPADKSPKPDKTWNPDWRTAMSTNPDRGWEVEMAIPLQAVGLKVPGTGEDPSLHTANGLNLHRSWSKLRQGTESWAWGRYLSSAKMILPAGSVGRAVLGKADAPFVRLHQCSGPLDQTLLLEGEVLNPSGEPVELETVLRTNASTLRLPQTHTLKPGATQRISERLLINDPSAVRVRLEITQRLKEGTKPVAQISVPFVQQQKAEVILKHYPTQKRLEVWLDLSLYKDVAVESLKAETELTAIIAASSLLVAARLDKFQGHAGMMELDLANVPPGDYVAATRIFSADKPLEINRQSFQVRPMPEWWDNKIGCTDQVPPPFEPVKADGREVQVWGRSYDFGQSCLPEQITTQGEGILAAPVRVLLNDSPVPHTTYPIPHTSTRAQWTARTTAEAFALEWSGWLEYDGFLWNTLRLSGQPGQKLHSFRLEIPLKKEWATLVNNYSYGLQGTGALPKEGMERGNSPVWLGNETGGLQWLTDHSSEWFNKGQPMEIIPKDDCVLLQIHFVDHEITLTQPLHWSFGLIATPVRPPPRKPIDNLEALCDMNAITWGYGNYQPHTTDWGNPLAWPDGSYGHQFRKDHANKFFPEGRESDSGPYVMLSVCAAGANSEPGRQMRDILDYWFYEWALDGKARWRPGLTGAQVSANSKSWQDFFVWQYAKLHERNRYTGLYYDVSMPEMGDNLQAGVGYRRADGTVASSLTLLGSRDIAKRLYTFLRQKESEGQIGYHLSGMLNGAVFPFCERMIDGENYYSLLNEAKPENYHVLSLATFRAQHFGTNLGPLGSWLPQAKRRFDPATHGKPMKELFGDPDRETRWIYGIVLLHNTDLWAAYLPGKADDVIEAMQRYQISNSRYDFLPYWKQKAVKIEGFQIRKPKPAKESKPTTGDTKPKAEKEKKAMADDPVVSVYREKDGERALLVVFNNTDSRGEIRLSVDWTTLRLDAAKAKVQNEASGKPARLEGDGIQVPITPRDLRLIGINGPPIPPKEEPPPEKMGEAEESEDEEDLGDESVPKLPEVKP